MANIIQFATGQELQTILEASNQMVAGMSPEEARAALKLVESGGKLMTGSATTGGASNVIQFPGTDASGAFNDYVSAGGTTSATNSATATATSSATIAQGVTEAGKTTVLGVLSMSLPTVAAAVAPILGVSLGAGLYSANPNLWTKISKTLLPFCYNDTEIAPALIDANGQVYINGKLVDSLQKFFERENIGQEGYISNLNVTNFALPIKTGNELYLKSKLISRGGSYKYEQLIVGPVTIPSNIKFAGNVNTSLTALNGVMASKEDVTFVIPAIEKLWKSSDATENDPPDGIYDASVTLKFGGDSVKYTSFYNLFPISAPYVEVTCPFSLSSDGQSLRIVNAENVARTIIGDRCEAYWPAGTEKWTGTRPANPATGSVNVTTSASGNTEPYYPITLPVGDPGVSNNPAIKPNPTAPVEFPEVGTYIPAIVKPSAYPLEIPVPDETARTSPIESYVPDLSVNLNPNANPSAEPAPAPEPAPEPAPDPYPDLKPPSSAGISPSVVFPLPGDFPSIVPVSGSGLIHVYNPTPEEMISFGNWLWVTYADASLQKIWNNPFDGVISAHELYATPSNDGRDNIRSGFLVCPTSASLVRQRYTTIDCGSMVVPEYYGNYLDYAPYSKAHVYLPFIGIVEVDVDDIVGHGVNITYHVDSYNGSCIAQITVAKTDYQNTVYQFSGNCSVEIPLAGGSQAAIKAGLISAASTGISSVVGGLASMFGGNIGGGIAGIAYGIGGAVSQAVSQKSSVQHSGTFGASYGAMGIKKPYFIIHRPIQKIVVSYNEDYGFPAHKRVRIGNCKGFLRVREVHAVSLTATDEEKARIEELLKNGVFVS